jgi:hypothetical protein
MFKLSDDQQFHQHQPNEQSFFISNHWTKKKTTIYGIGNLSPGLEQSQECDGIKPIKEIPIWNKLIFSAYFLTLDIHYVVNII